MLVDDSSTVLLTLTDVFKTARYGVETAENGEDALDKLATGLKVDLLITDLNMPGMDGIELIKMVRTLPKYKYIPILFLTTEAQQKKRLEAKAAGASGWIVKPVTGEDLLKTVKLVLH